MHSGNGRERANEKGREGASEREREGEGEREREERSVISELINSLHIANDAHGARAGARLPWVGERHDLTGEQPRCI